MVNLKEECPFPGLSSHGSGHHGDDNVCLNQHCGVCECDKEEIKHYSWLIDSQEDQDQKEEEEMVEDCERDNQPSSSSSNKDNDEMEDEMVDVISEDEMKSSSSFLFNSQLFQPW